MPNTIITFGMTEEEFFSPNPDSTGVDPYLAFEEWAAANGYDLDDDEQRAAAIEAYDSAEMPPQRVTT